MVRAATLKGLLLPAALVAAAEIGGRMVDLSSSNSLALPSAIARAFVQAVADGSLLAATRDTLASVGAGLAIGASAGLLLGIVFGMLPVADRLMEATVESIRPIPAVAMLPVALIALGFGYGLEIAIVAFASLWSPLILARSAVRDIEPRLIEVSRALRLDSGGHISKIVIPAALPRIFVAFRLAVGVALIVAVTVEIAINPLGIGFAMMTAQQALRPDLMLAYLIWLGFIGLGLNSAMVFAQQRLFGRAAMIEDIR